MDKQTVGSLETDGPLTRQRIFFADHTPSWVRPPAKGTASLELGGHTGRPWLTISLAEYGEKSAKTTMVTLDVDSIRALRDHCNLVLGEKTPRRMWVNQPSKSQPLHYLHGVNVIAILERDNITARIYPTAGETVSLQVPWAVLSEGWKS